MSHLLLRDLVVVFGLGLVVVLVFAKLRLPAVIGLLLTGVVVGPYGLRLVGDPRSVEVLTEVGIVVLLFTIGVEFSMAGMVRLGRVMVIGGTLQMALTIAAAAGVAKGVGAEWGTAIAVGFVVASSSTAIVMRILTERNEVASPQGRVSLGILILQDLAVVPLILALPFLKGGGSGSEAAAMLGKAAAVVTGVLLLAGWFVPLLLQQIVRTRSRELFLLTIVFVCLGTAWFTSAVGLSIALGAFLAGLVISRSEYSHQALGEIVPFRDAFNSLFFVSIGMLLDIRQVAANPLPVVGATVGILFGKALIVTVVTLALRYPLRIAIITGVLLFQIGEFSFILLHAAAKVQLINGGALQVLMAATVLSMAITPIAATVAPAIANRLARVVPGGPLPKPPPLRDHVIVAGYGLTGQNVVRVLQHVGVRCVIIEMNPDTVQRLREAHERVVFGDAGRPEVLKQAGIESARVMVVAVPDATSTRAITQTALQINDGIHLIVRTRFAGEVPELRRLGAHEVVAEEFETSIEVFSRVLRKYLVPRDEMDKLVRKTRDSAYEMLRTPQERFGPATELAGMLTDTELAVYRVAEGSSIVGKTLVEAGLRERRALVLAFHRDGTTMTNPPADWRLQRGDVALLLASPDALSQVSALFRSPDAAVGR